MPRISFECHKPKNSLESEIKDVLDKHVQDVFCKFLTAYEKSGDDMDVFDKYNLALDALTNVLVYMIENNPTEK